MKTAKSAKAAKEITQEDVLRALRIAYISFSSIPDPLSDGAKEEAAHQLRCLKAAMDFIRGRIPLTSHSSRQ